jgi:hypothetical protein
VPLIIAAKLPPGGSGTGDAGALRGIQSAVRATPGVARVTPPVVSSDRTATMMIAYPTTRQQDTATNDMVHRLRDIVLPQATAGTGIRAYVGGPNADAVDFADLVNQRLPWLIGIVVGLSVLLMVVFRSVTVAIRAAVMNLLCISAAYGVLTAVVQWSAGLRALDALRVGEHVRSQAVLEGQAGIRDAAGRWLSRTDTAELERRYGATAMIHRADLLAVLCAAVPGESLRRGVTVSGVRPDGSVVHSPR